MIPPRPDLDDDLGGPLGQVSVGEASADHEVPWRWWHVLVLYVTVTFGSGLLIGLALASVGDVPSADALSGTLFVVISLVLDLVLVGAMMVFLRRVSSQPARDVGVPERSERGRGVLLGLGFGVALYVGAAIVQVVLAVALSAIAGRSIDPPDQVPGDLTSLGWAAQVLLALLVAPVAEELFFRGLLFRSLRRYGFATAALVSGAIFGAVHLVGAPVLDGLLLQLPLAGVGVALAWLADRRGLTASIGAHMAFNVVGIVLIVTLG